MKYPHDSSQHVNKIKQLKQLSAYRVIQRTYLYLNNLAEDAFSFWERKLPIPQRVLLIFMYVKGNDKSTCIQIYM